MLDTELVRKARDLYVQTRNLTRVYREIKRLDYVVSMSTLKRWKKEGSWDEYAKELDARLNEFNQVVLDFEKEILEDLIILARDLKKEIKESEKRDSQLIYSYLGVVKQIQELKKVDQVDEEAILDEVIRILIDDPVIGPVLQSRKDVVMKRLKKMEKQEIAGRILHNLKSSKELSLLDWTLNHILLRGVPFSFEGHEYLRELYTETHHHEVFQLYEQPYSVRVSRLHPLP